MKTSAYRIISFYFLAFLVVMIIPSVSAVGVGIGPSDLQINNALRGASVERSVTVFNLAEAESIIMLKAEGVPAGWINFYEIGGATTPITSIALGPRENKTLIIRFSIPADTANGMYNATIHALVIPASTAQPGVGVTTILEAVSNVVVEVTGEQTVAGSSEYIMVDNTEVNAPVSIRVLFRNTGNVAVNPEIIASISGSNGIIDTLSYAGTQVDPGSAETIAVQWTKTGIDPGDYNADVKVRLGSAQIAEQNITFTIAPAGTFSRQGNLTNLDYEGNLVPDTVLKIIGTFENTGKIETRAKLVGEVYRDTVLVDTFTSEELSVPVNGIGDLTYYLKVTSPGAYTIKAYALYEGKKTAPEELTFTVVAAQSTNTQGALPLQPGLAISALLVSIVLIALKKRGSQ